MCSVNIRGHEANFYEAEARCHEADIEAEARKSEADIPVKQCCDSPVRPSVCLSVTCSGLINGAFEAVVTIITVSSMRTNAA